MALAWPLNTDFTVLTNAVQRPRSALLLLDLINDLLQKIILFVDKNFTIWKRLVLRGSEAEGGETCYVHLF